MNRRLLSVCLSALLIPTALTASADAHSNSVDITAGDLRCSITYYTDSIVRVVKTPLTTPTEPDPSLVVTLAPQSDLDIRVHDGGRTVSLASPALTVSVDKRTGDVRFSHGGRQLLGENASLLEPISTGAESGKLRVGQTFSLDKGEAVYGLGTVQDGKLNRRGSSIFMEQSNQQDYQNIIQSVKGWGLYWDNCSPTEFTDNDSGMTLTSQVGKAIDYYFMYGGTADNVVGLIRQLSGTVPMFPLWSYGFMQSRERYRSQEELLDVVRTYREQHIPLDCIIQDWQYWGNNYLWNAMEFLSENFGAAQQMIDEVHRNNARMMISIWASFGPQTKQYRELAAKDLLLDFPTWPESGLSLWPPRPDYPSGVRVYDVYSAEARDIYWQHLRRLYDMGIDAWWMDSTDPDCFNPTEADYDRKVGDDGSDATFRSLRNAFPLCTVGGVYSHQRKDDRGKRIFIMTRSAFAGQQRYASNLWSGDIASSWDVLRKQIPAGLSFTLTGNPNFNTDIGGFFCSAYNTAGPESAPANPQYQELYVRWMQYGLFAPVFRSHGTDAPREIYRFGKPGDQIYDAIARTIRFRYRLLPYLYTTAWQCTSGNDSYMRPLFADFRSDKRTWNTTDAFMFGQNILAAPVVSAHYTDENVSGSATAVPAVDFLEPRTHSVYLPAGTDWFDFQTGKRYRGGRTADVTTDINSVPMFVRKGSILPLGPEMEYVGQKNWQTLEIRVYPGADAAFRLYEDEGDSYNYENGAYSIIPFDWDNSSHTLTVGQRSGNFPGMIPQRTFTVVLPDGTSKTIDYNGTPITTKF